MPGSTPLTVNGRMPFWALGTAMLERLRNLLPRQKTNPRDCVMVVGLGAMKSGTSWLSGYLRSIPNFLHSPVKEMNVFNMFCDNPNRHRDERFRLLRMDQILLRPRPFDQPEAVDRLRALAQIAHINDPEAYLAYFAERLNGHTHFGEISPSYSHLSLDTLKLMSGLTRDVRFLFLMRDPARRAASHIRHVRSRTRPDVPIDVFLAEIEPGRDIWLRSDYGGTLDRLEQAGLADKTRVMTYETLFKDETMQGLCDWLGLPFRKPRPDRVVNQGRSDELTQAQHDQLRERLDPIYADLARRDLPAGAERWRWT
ncbi:hypothetical protein EI545_14920 [Tabrizicola piscis]|uniref:Sulfotransferase n=2 Tax=Tabrizicola piscis TaxID=2494374 RepID=A0A3S8U8Z6_9RHOB|nr:hypothetical protein EI545_14920 [Tabrizicola piscis]